MPIGRLDLGCVGGLAAAVAKALAFEGDQARSDVCNAFGKLAGRDIPYDRCVPVDKKRKIIARWRQWWVVVRKDHR